MKIFWLALLLSAHCELTLSLLRKHIFNDALKTWRDAQVECRVKYADLSVFDSETELEHFKEDGKDHMNEESWVGLSKASANDRWVWSDGSQGQFFNWQSGQPNNPSTDFCAKSSKGELLDFQCGASYPFFCYSWEPELFFVNQKKSWKEAFEYCKTVHRGLACLPSKQHLLQVQQITLNGNIERVWTGLRFLAGYWFWVDGGVLGDLVDLSACPTKAQFCGARNLQENRWESRNCSEQLYAVCY